MTISDDTLYGLTGAQIKELPGKISSRIKTNAGAPTTATSGTVGQLLEDTTNGKLYICTDGTGPYVWEEVGGDTITVDTEMSSTSTNPVQNRVIYAEIGQLDSVLARLTTGTGIGGGN